MPNRNVFTSAFQTARDGELGLGKRPVVLDIIGPDRRTSLLPDDLKMVLHVNPTSLQMSYSQQIEVLQTKGGFVEQHWGSEPTEIAIEQATGAFARLYVGLISATGPGPFNDLVRPNSTQARNIGGTRRETIAYDKYLDMLALFHNNGQVYDQNGQIVFSGKIKMTFDGGIYFGWFSDFGVEESAGKPYQFDLTTNFTIEEEILRLRTQPFNPQADFLDGRTGGFSTTGPTQGTEALDLLTDIGESLALSDVEG